MNRQRKLSNAIPETQEELDSCKFRLPKHRQQPSPEADAAEQDAMWSAAYEPELEQPPAAASAKTQHPFSTELATCQYERDQLRETVTRLRQSRDRLLAALRLLEGWVVRVVVPKYSDRNPIPKNAQEALDAARVAIAAEREATQ